MPIKQHSRIVIKVGSNVLTSDNHSLDTVRIKKISQQISTLKRQGIEVILVSSGAVASGRSLLSLGKKTDEISQRQLFAAIGQIKLINLYAEMFEEQNLLCAQVLVTKEDFRDREHYINMKNCISVLLQNNVIPILNEKTQHNFGAEFTK